MIKIKKDNDEKIVTKGVYESVFKRLGYELVETKAKAKEVVAKPVVKTTDEKLTDKIVNKDVVQDK